MDNPDEVVNGNINFDARGSIVDSDASSRVHAASIANSDNVAPLLEEFGYDGGRP